MIWSQQRFLKKQEALTIDGKVRNHTPPKLRTSVLQKTLLRKCKDKPQTERKHQQYRYLTNTLYPRYVKNWYNSMRRSNAVGENKQKSRIAISKQVIQIKLSSEIKDNQHHWLSKKCKLKLRDTTYTRTRIHKSKKTNNTKW